MSVSSPDAISLALARDRLRASSVVSFVMSSAAPFTVVAGVVTTGFAVTGNTSLPAAFIVIGVVLAIFSVGFITMATQMPNAGAFYTYIAAGLGKPLGVGGALVAVVAYNALQVGLYGGIGAVGAPYISDKIGFDTPWWVIALLAWAITSLFGVLQVDVNGKLLALLLAAEILVIVVFSVANVLNPAEGGATAESINPVGLVGSGVGAVFALAVLANVGFEGAPVYSEELRDVNRTLPVAIFTSIVLIAVLYTFGSWALIVAVGPDQVAAQAAEQGPGLVFGLAGQHLGAVWADIGQVLFLTSVLAAAIAFHNTTARYTYSLGRERVMPLALARTNRRGAPFAASLLQSTIGLAVIVGYAAAGLDPLIHLFFWLGTSGGIGVLLLLAATSIAVVVYFLRHRVDGVGFVRTFLFPLAGMVLLLAVAATVVAKGDVLLGVAPDHPLRFIVPAAYTVVAAVGVIYGLTLMATRPAVYANIGLGAKAVTATGGPRHADGEDTNAWAQEMTR